MAPGNVVEMYYGDICLYAVVVKNVTILTHIFSLGKEMELLFRCLVMLKNIFKCLFSFV